MAMDFMISVMIVGIPATLAPRYVPMGVVLIPETIAASQEIAFWNVRSDRRDALTDSASLQELVSPLVLQTVRVLQIPAQVKPVLMGVGEAVVVLRVQVVQEKFAEMMDAGEVVEVVPLHKLVSLEPASVLADRRNVRMGVVNR